MIILYIIGAIIWFLVISFFGLIGPTDVTANTLEAFRNNFFRLELRDFGVILLSLAPLILIILSLKRFRALAISLVVILMVLTTFFVVKSSTPTKAKAMMKLPLVIDAYNIKYSYVESFTYTSIYVEFDSKQSSESILNFYHRYFTNHGYEKAPTNWRSWYWNDGVGVVYICEDNSDDDIGVRVEGNKVRLDPFYKFGEYCLDKL